MGLEGGPIADMKKHENVLINDMLFNVDARKAFQWVEGIGFSQSRDEKLSFPTAKQRPQGTEGSTLERCSWS